MSAKAMGRVWDLDLPANKLIILLAYADHAEHDGTGIYPSVGKIAWKTGYKERTVQRVTADLVADGLLVPDGKGPFGTNRYKFDYEAGKKKEPFVSKRKRAALDDKMTPETQEGDKMSSDMGSDKLTPDMDASGGDILTGGGDKLTSPDSGDKLTQGGDTQMSPEPSLDSFSSEPSISESSSSVLVPTTPPPDDDDDKILPFSEKAVGEGETKVTLLQSIMDEWKDIRAGNIPQGKAGDEERAMIRDDLLEHGETCIRHAMRAARDSAQRKGQKIWSWNFVRLFMETKTKGVTTDLEPGVPDTPKAYTQGRFGAFVNTAPDLEESA